MHGETPDISVFRFQFFEPIYYHNSNAQFPQPNMLLGHFLGIARTTGVSFTFVIITDGGRKGITMHRCIIRKRQAQDNKGHTEYNTDWEVHINENNADNETEGMNKNDI
jgi:hypothetical protein